MVDGRQDRNRGGSSKKAVGWGGVVVAVKITVKG